MVAAAGSAVGIAEGMSARPLAPWVRVGATATVIVTARADRMSARPLAPVEELTIDAAGMPMGAAPLDMIAAARRAARRANTDTLVFSERTPTGRAVSLWDELRTWDPGD